MTSVAEQVDPIKLNQTLSATAQALDGLGDRFGQSIVNGNEILADLNPQMPQIRRDNQLLADLADVYANAAPDLFDGLENAVTTARTLNEQQGNIDQALMAAVGFGNTGGEIFEKRRPVPDPRRRGPAADVGAARRVQPRAVLHDPQLPRRRAEGRRVARRQRLLAEHALGGPRCRQRVRLPGQPAARERPRRTGGPARLLAARHRVTCGRPVPGDGHRRLHRAVQPLRTRLSPRSSNTSGDARSGRTRSTHENHRYSHQARRLVLGAAAVHRDHHRGVRPDAVRPHERLLGDLQQRQRPARRAVRPRVGRGGRQGLQRRAASTAAARSQGRLRRRPSICSCSRAPRPRSAT